VRLLGKILVGLLVAFAHFLAKKMNLNVTLPDAAPDPVAAVTAGEKLAGAIVEGVTQVDKEENTPSNDVATIEDHKLKVDQAAAQALQDGDVETLRKMWQVAAKLILLACLLNFTGCSALNHQKLINDAAQTPYYDSSTPPQYPTAFDSGVLYTLKDGNKRLVVITRNKAKSEPTARPHIDRFGNHVFSVDGSVPLTEIDAQQDADARKLETAK
jgi:hypothetical protein